jgi:hypothetical protein
MSFKPGDIVYYVYSPAKCGKVLSTDKGGTEVKWLKKGNPVEIVPPHVLRSYWGLMVDTAEKLTNHAARYNKAKAL